MRVPGFRPPAILHRPRIPHRPRRLIVALALAVAGAFTLSSFAGATAAQASTPQQAGMAELMLSYNSSNGLIGNSWWQSAVAVSTVMTKSRFEISAAVAAKVSGVSVGKPKMNDPRT